LLSKTSTAPAALLVSGEAGIGKTTVWLAGLAQARECGFEVLAARPVAGEATLAYASIADLLSRVDSGLWSSLPDPQRQALERILLQDDHNGAPSGRRAAATALLSVVHRLAEATPVLLAVDDLQWLDPVSADTLSFVTRRLCGRVGVLATMRTPADSASALTGLETHNVSDMRRITLAPLTLGALHAALTERLGRSLPRPALVRIHDISGGNPFYALELALAMTGSTASGDATLPGTLTDVVRTRVGTLSDDVQQVLVAAAAVDAPTVEMVAQALNMAPTNVIGLLERAENAGIVKIDGHRLRFAHPLLTRGVYSGASPATRRRMHRSLAEIMVEPESRARHLALAAATDDPRTVRLLDSAAESARLRGAQATAAELLDLALGLGGDTPERLIRSARCHFAAGDVRHARGLLELSISRLAPGPERARALGVLAYLSLFDDGFCAAVELLRQGLAESAEPCPARVTMLIGLAFTQMNIGNADAAMCSAATACDEAAELGEAALLSQALGMRLVLAMLRGDGLDEADLRRALGLTDSRVDTATAFRTNHAVMRAWSGQLEQAHTEIAAHCKRCVDGGYEHEQLYLGFHSALIEIWRGNFAVAATITKEATERAQQMGGDLPQAMVATMQATLDAYTGRVQDAREGSRAALEMARRCGAHTLERSTITTLAFLESSLGDYRAVAELLEPQLEADAETPRATEIATAAYFPDAIEALINLGRLSAAEALVDRLGRNGARLDRAWMLAVGGRCRAMLHAAHGDLDVAIHAVEQAMAQHDRLPMPFERARTQLVLGQIQRRQRRKDAAAATLAAAMATFETLNTPLWVAGLI
jgi:tetratricopeptide (TPR) repeat protein